eukprot:GFUD01004809.1.p1 GENE.GFUD01004809.1~~GFUD01004809.1.p1  ORF type:complete len:112 (+),score=16.38 GFUD01004809.1:60-395(+)
MFSFAFLLLILTGFANSSKFNFEYPETNHFPSMQKSYRPTEGCADVERAFRDFCSPAPGSDGLTWAEVENCQTLLGTLLGTIALKEEDFELIDENGDGMLTIEEWKKFKGC